MTAVTIRHDELRRMLKERRRELEDDVRRRIRDGREKRAKDSGDDLELSDANHQGDLELALLQMRAETLARLDEALARLDAGEYGSCVECGGEIPEPRLRALPFAVRCQACAKRREDLGQEAGPARRRGTFSLFPEPVRP